MADSVSVRAVQSTPSVSRSGADRSAATLLHSVGEPVPSSTDGDVLRPLFAEGTQPATAPVRTRAAVDGAGEAETAEDFSDVEDRLRGLGYMD